MDERAEAADGSSAKQPSAGLDMACERQTSVETPTGSNQSMGGRGTLVVGRVGGERLRRAILACLNPVRKISVCQMSFPCVCMGGLFCASGGFCAARRDPAPAAKDAVIDRFKEDRSLA